jgi:hypothetical protein
MGEQRNTYRLFVGKPEEKKRPSGRPRRRWKDNIKMDYGETGLVWLMTETSGGLL